MKSRSRHDFSTPWPGAQKPSAGEGRATMLEMTQSFAPRFYRANFARWRRVLDYVARRSKTERKKKPGHSARNDKVVPVHTGPRALLQSKDPNEDTSLQ